VEAPSASTRDRVPSRWQHRVRHTAASRRKRPPSDSDKRCSHSKLRQGLPLRPTPRPSASLLRRLAGGPAQWRGAGDEMPVRAACALRCGRQRPHATDALRRRAIAQCPGSVPPPIALPRLRRLAGGPAQWRGVGDERLVRAACALRCGRQRPHATDALRRRAIAQCRGSVPPADRPAPPS